MLAFGIRYLNGFSVASEPDELERAEWPPHPARIFMALAAAHFQSNADPAERAALLWLEGTGRGGAIAAPALLVPDARPRAVVRHYVPVNDKPEQSKALLHGLPLTRKRQERTFARAWLEHDIVYLCWRGLEPPEHHRKALANLCAKVTRIGHSSSLVQMWLAGPEEVGEPNWVPDETRAIVQLRVPGPGTLEYLEQQYNAASVEDYAALQVAEVEASDRKIRRITKRRLKEEYGNQPPPRQRPRLSVYLGYARSFFEAHAVGAMGSVFSPHLLIMQLRVKQGAYRHLDLLSTLRLTSRWREAILSQSNSLSEPVRRMLSGHDSNCKPLEEPHLAFLPIGFVGNEHADGRLLGMGLALPAAVSGDARREALRAIATIRELKLGPLGVWHVEPVKVSPSLWNLRAETWTAHPQGATHWSSVTPIAFDRHPKVKDRAPFQQEAATVIAEGCARIGLPKPREVVVTQVSTHLGVPPSFAFPRLKRKDGSERQHSHAILVFDEPVWGPLLIGAGRYRGYGVCRPMGDSNARS